MRVLKNRFRSAKDFLEVVDQTIPQGGMFCRTTKSLEAGEEVVVEIYFPGLPNKILLSGKTQWWRSALPRLGVRAGALVAFHAEEAEKRDFLVSIARGKKAPVIKRRHPRLPVHIPVKWREANTNDAYDGELRDISIGGAQIVTEKTLNLQELLILDFVAPGGAQPISIAAEVTYRTPAGYGLRFQYRDGGGSRRLREVIRRLVQA